MPIKFTTIEIPLINDSSTKFLNRIPNIKYKILERIYLSLGKYLFNRKIGNKEALKGNLKGFYSARVGFGYVAIYIINGELSKHAEVLKIMTEEDYHDWLKRY